MRSRHCQLGRRPPGPVRGSLVGSAGATNTMPSTRAGALRSGSAVHVLARTTLHGQKA